MNLGFYGYLAASAASALFAILLMFSWRASLQARLLLLVMVISSIWAGLGALVALNGEFYFTTYQIFETLRYIGWFVFLLKLLDLASIRAEGYRKFVRLAMPLCIGFSVLLMAEEYFLFSGRPVLSVIGHVLLPLIGLAIIEQLYRNTADRHRWAIKYMFIGVGALFAYDFYLYSDTLLFRRMDQDLWEARGIVNVFVLPLLLISSARSKNWSMNVFVSRDIVLNSTAIVGGGLYLLFMAGGGYYLREFGGDWGRVSQVVFLVLGLMLLAAVLTSGQLRAQVRVFLGKHFYKNKYDYRQEWLQLTENLSSKVDNKARYRAVIKALAHTVDARAGVLCMLDDDNVLQPVAAWQCRLPDEDSVCRSDALLMFLRNKRYIINVTELNTRKDEYEGLELPEWIHDLGSPWLIVPLFGPEEFVGMMILAKPLVERAINWEDRDLLKTAAKQVSSHLLVLRTSDALAEAKQFEVFSRLSAYMVHDLKNIAAELQMVARNANRHIDNPAFVADAFETVENAADDIGRLLDQLRNRRLHIEKKVIFDLGELLPSVIENRRGATPDPSLDVSGSEFYVIAEKQRLANVLGHLIDNAQQATNASGTVEISLRNNDQMNIIDIKDDGIGMDSEFVRERLFKPFDTTKGNAGMGIGMYESREFIRGLGGDIHVQTEPGKGTIMSLHIPSIQPASPKAATA